jgi:hypothetical protein
VDQPDTRNPTLVAFAERLTDAWKAAGHPSRAAAAIAAKTTGGYFARLCAGTVEPGITIVERLAVAFEIDAGYLAFGSALIPEVLPGERPKASTAPSEKRGKRTTERRARKVK